MPMLAIVGVRRDWTLIPPLQPFQEQSSNQDIDVMPVWDKGITGKGAVVCVCDDGVEHDHTV